MPRDYRDITAGALLILIGLLFSWRAYEKLELGTFRQMGPGMFPLGLGIILALIGILVLVPALLRRGEPVSIRFWTPLFVLASIAAFAILIRPFGLMAATVAVVVIASFAELRVRPVGIAALSVMMCVLSWVTFDLGLGLAIPMFNWPF